jgi:hypothetical protein
VGKVLGAGHRQDVFRGERSFERLQIRAPFQLRRAISEMYAKKQIVDLQWHFNGKDYSIPTKFVKKSSKSTTLFWRGSDEPASYISVTDDAISGILRVEKDILALSGGIGDSLVIRQLDKKKLDDIPRQEAPYAPPPPPGPPPSSPQSVKGDVSQKLRLLLVFNKDVCEPTDLTAAQTVETQLKSSWTEQMQKGIEVVFVCVKYDTSGKASTSLSALRENTVVESKRKALKGDMVAGVQDLSDAGGIGYRLTDGIQWPYMFSVVDHDAIGIFAYEHELGYLPPIILSFCVYPDLLFLIGIILECK